jgi:membrane-bound ClpP family serine protease
MRGKAMVVLASFAISILLVTLIAQLVLFLKTRNPSAWLVGIISALIFLPVLIMLSLSISPDRYAGLWLFFGYPWLVVANIQLSDIILAFAGQISVIIALTLQLIYQLQRAKMRET